MGITLRSGTSGQGAIYFSDGTSGDDEYRGIINYNHASNFFSFFTNASERMRIDSSGRVLLGTSTAVDNPTVQTGGTKSPEAGIPKGQVNVADHAAFNVTDNGGAIAFSAKYHSNGALTTMGSIEGCKNNNNSSDYGGNLVFRTRSNGSTNNIGMRLTNNGLCFGTDNAAANGYVCKNWKVSCMSF